MNNTDTDTDTATAHATRVAHMVADMLPAGAAEITNGLPGEDVVLTTVYANGEVQVRALFDAERSRWSVLRFDPFTGDLVEAVEGVRGMLRHLGHAVTRAVTTSAADAAEEQTAGDAELDRQAFARAHTHADVDAAVSALAALGITDDHLHVLLDQQRVSTDVSEPWLGYDAEVDPTDPKTSEDGWTALANQARGVLGELLGRA